ncbi:MAG: glycosyltransferase family 2 protein [Deltaproteobacteria bacterium]
METPLFSVITPSLNQGQFIEETIKSVISQEGDFYIEYIIMDGGSSDNTLNIIKKYEGLLKNKGQGLRCRGVEFRWVSEKDNGQSDAINKGFKMAKGDIFAWINSDDAFYEGAFSIVHKHFLENPAHDIVYGNGAIIDEQGEVVQGWRSRRYDLKALKSYHFRWHEFSNYILQPTVFLRKGVFDKIGPLDETLHYAMDIEYWIRAGEHGLGLCHINKRLAKFRMTKGTKTSSSPTVFWEEQLEVFRRHNRDTKMRRFFAEYFYSLSIHNGFDIPAAKKEFNATLKRWACLPADELNGLNEEAGKGLQTGLLKIANEAFLKGERAKAEIAAGEAIMSAPLLRMHPLNMFFCVKKLLGRKVSLILSGIYRNALKTCWHMRYNTRG